MSLLKSLKQKNYIDKAEPGFLHWVKENNKKLSEFFAAHEFECRCANKSCRIQKVNLELIERLERFRVEFGEPIRITNGYRCDAYQRDLARRGYKTAKKSQHLLGNAVDCLPARTSGDANKRFKKFLKIAEKHFNAIGIANGWIHVDIRDDKKRRWTY